MLSRKSNKKEIYIQTDRYFEAMYNAFVKNILNLENFKGK